MLLLNDVIGGRIQDHCLFQSYYIAADFKLYLLAFLPLILLRTRLMLSIAVTAVFACATTAVNFYMLYNGQPNVYLRMNGKFETATQMMNAGAFILFHPINCIGR